MLAGFVTDEQDLDFVEAKLHEPTNISKMSGSTSTTQELDDRVFPHPWTGVSPEIQIMFSKVGRLIRANCQISLVRSAPRSDLSLDPDFDLGASLEFFAILNLVAEAETLEEQLLSFEPPSITSLVDAGDENTPVQQYLSLAEAYRCAALIEIYRVFPDILQKRAAVAGSFPPGLVRNGELISSQLLALLSVPQDPNDLITSLALHVVSILESIPSSSGTRCLQPIVLIAAACELRFSSSSPSAFPFEDLTSVSFVNAPILNGISSRELDIAAGRRFVVTRLQEFQLSLPAKPITKALQLIQETWDRSDLGQHVFWVDVMNEMGWQTIFG